MYTYLHILYVLSYIYMQTHLYTFIHILIHSFSHSLIIPPHDYMLAYTHSFILS